MTHQETAEEAFEVKKAVRHAVPQIMSIWGVTFSGKTFGAIMVAAGLVKMGGKVGVIDTENGRFSAYADDPDVQRVLPQGCYVIDLHPPFHPKRYIAAIHQLERDGCEVIIIDSGSHAWSEEGGALDMKERDKGWVQAKLWTKRFLAAIRYSNSHVIVALRAQEKTKILGTGKDQKYIPLGILPICDKAFPYDLGLAFSVDGEVDGKPATHLATPVKWPKAMNSLFNDWMPQLLTPEVGRKIREWNESGTAQDQWEPTRKRARATAEEGITAYKAFCASLTAPAKKAMGKALYDELLARAAEVDALTQAAAEEAGASVTPTDASEAPHGETVAQRSPL